MFIRYDGTLELLKEFYFTLFALTPEQPLKVRLVGGSADSEGRVEVLYQETWGTVCDDSWDLDDATVVCRMLGYTGATDAPGNAAFGQGTGPIILDDVQCAGVEENLADCEHNPFGVHDCSHREDAGVRCTNETEG